jgi:hypothetical protein
MRKPAGIASRAGIEIVDRKLAREACDARISVELYLEVVNACGNTVWSAASPVKWRTFHANLEKLEKVGR